jgi:hypothetical protein
VVIVWKQMDQALVGAISLRDGEKASVVLVAEPKIPKGALVLISQGDDKPAPVPLSEIHARLNPSDMVDIVCTQERAFGSHGLSKPACMAEK